MTDTEFSFVKHKILRLTGVDLDCYKSQQVKRRLGVYLRRSGHANWPGYFRAIQNDPTELGKLKNYLTINVSSFMRDPERFAYLRESVLPELLRHRPRLRVWSAGCSHGHEPYSLAILLAETSGLHSSHLIYATDLDGAALERAHAGGPYSVIDLKDVPPELRSRYFRADGDDYYVIDALRRKVRFAQHNLLADPFGGQFDLIVCRNVVIYFQLEAKVQLYQRFHNALRAGGVLFVGGTEVVSKPSSIGFELLSTSFYQRSDPKEALPGARRTGPRVPQSPLPGGHGSRGQVRAA
jgi:chemotaxis protein methyltransferase CheR